MYVCKIQYIYTLFRTYCNSYVLCPDNCGKNKIECRTYCNSYVLYPDHGGKNKIEFRGFTESYGFKQARDQMINSDSLSAHNEPAFIDFDETPSIEKCPKLKMRKENSEEQMRKLKM